MNKYIQFLCLVVLSIGTCTAQIGINTENPIKIFNIDVLGNNPLFNPQASNNLKDDLIFRLNVNSEANLVLGGETLSTEREASLELNDPNKALLLNRVSLKSVSDATTVTSPREGMMVYNTSTSGTEEEIVTPGIYLSMNRQWSRLRDKESTGGTASKIGELAGNNNQQYASGLLSDIGTGAGATKLPLNGGDIVISEAGRYIFNFRLYGAISGTVVYGDFYLYLFKQNGATEELLTSMNMIVVKGAGNWATYTPVMVTPHLEAGDIIIIRFGRVGATSWGLVKNPRTSANCTSFVYWKMQ